APALAPGWPACPVPHGRAPGGRAQRRQAAWALQVSWPRDQAAVDEEQNSQVESSRSRPRDVVLLGSTGSVGTQAADVIRRNPGRFRITGLAAGGSNPDLLAAQAIEFGVGVVAVAQESAAGDVREALKAHAVRAGRPRTGQWPTALTGQRLALPARPGPHSGPGHAGGGGGPAAGGHGQAGDGRAPPPTVLAGPDAIAEVAAWSADVVLNAVTGFSGLAATLAALRAGRVLALANKESLITGGPLVAGLAAPGQIVPVDSE